MAKRRKGSKGESQSQPRSRRVLGSETTKLDPRLCAPAAIGRETDRASCLEELRTGSDIVTRPLGRSRGKSKSSHGKQEVVRRTSNGQGTGNGPTPVEGNGPTPLNLRGASTGTFSLLGHLTAHGQQRAVDTDTVPVVLDARTLRDADRIARELGARRVVERNVFADVPVEQLARVARDERVVYVESSTKLRPCLEFAHEATNLRTSGGDWSVDETGSGVLVGIVDTGIDASHPGFFAGEVSRIVDYLDQETEEHYPEGADGSIDHALAAENAPDVNGHGTHVAGIAAGNGEHGLNDGFQGVAPNADLAIVKTTFDSTDIAMAVAHIFDVADERNQDCVVNLSLGGHFGPHDGTSLVERTIDDLCRAPGRVVVVAAGNEADSRCHAHTRLRSDGVQPGRWTADLEVLAREISGTTLGATWVQVWSRREDSVQVTLRSPNGKLFAAERERTIEHRQDEFILEIVEQESPLTGDRSVYFSITTLPDQQWLNGWSIIVEEKSPGSASVGAVHAWTGDGSARFNSGMTRSHLVGMPGTSFSAITVASYATRSAWSSRDPDEPEVVLDAIKHGDISYFSSPGPTRDEANKPELAAPGQWIVSALSSQAEARMPLWRQLPDDVPYAAMQGTSMAAPYVAGAIALLLEKSPGLRWAEIKRKLVRSVNQDEFTTPCWNARWGYGKLDVERLLS